MLFYKWNNNRDKQDVYFSSQKMPKFISLTLKNISIQHNLTAQNICQFLCSKNGDFFIDKKNPTYTSIAYWLNWPSTVMYTSMFYLPEGLFALVLHLLSMHQWESRKMDKGYLAKLPKPRQNDQMIIISIK